MIDLTWLYAQCIDCTRQVHERNPMPDDYAKTRADLVMRTLGMESNFEHRRQLSITHPEGTAGGNGLCQVELTTLSWMLDKLDNKPLLARRFRDWLFGDMERPYPIDWYRMAKENGLLWQVRSDDRLAVALCSMRYLFAPGEVPRDVSAQFYYWLEFYNGRGVLKHSNEVDALDRWWGVLHV